MNGETWTPMRLLAALARPSAEGAAFMSFALIGSGAAIGFVALTSLALTLLPEADGWLVNAICYAAFVVPVYLLHRRFSFRSVAAHRQAMPRYVAVQAMSLLLAAAFGYLLHDALALPSLPAAVLVIGLTSGVNFVVLRGWAFAVRRAGPAAA